ncbi:MAG: hypothetical protein D6679_06995 [Candidatus Hydrogenedentota bacterium]|nr:MAG: hypothetical protein D6679_06995 [Candidatus Hydrogenedentota bacterium]
MSRVVIDPEVLGTLAEVLRGKSLPPFSFTEPAEFFPPVGHPRALEYFFAVVMHQYGFWFLEGERWNGVFLGVRDGRTLKGSDFVWYTATRDLLANEPVLTRFHDDSGTSPLPMKETHEKFTITFAAFKKSHSLEAIVSDAAKRRDGVAFFVRSLSELPGYREDPLKKKAMLLAMALANRPERFLPFSPEDREAGWGPVIDYHIQRTSLRTGLVRIEDESLAQRLIERVAVSKDEEADIRNTVFEAMRELERLSGTSHAALDLLFFTARRVCPETKPPRCVECLLEPVCRKRKELFQPVFRTTYY